MEPNGYWLSVPEGMTLVSRWKPIWKTFWFPSSYCPNIALCVCNHRFVFDASYPCHAGGGAVSASLLSACRLKRTPLSHTSPLNVSTSPQNSSQLTKQTKLRLEVKKIASVQGGRKHSTGRLWTSACIHFPLFIIADKIVAGSSCSVCRNSAVDFKIAWRS